jgi:CheY-like chemotaxis protein
MLANAAQTRALPEAISGRVLVVEDQAVNRAVVVRLLEKLGCSVDSAENGREALAAVAKQEYDLVLMDCQMPEMDGFEATAQIRRKEDSGRRVPIVALTAAALAGDRERCLAAGMDDYLTKPVRREQLESLVRRMLDV